VLESLTVWRFDTPSGADAAQPQFERLAAGAVVRIEDAALVAWPEGLRKPSLRHLGTLLGPGEYWGGLWGVLMGLIFVVPIAGPAFGAAAAAFAGSLSGFGFDDEFVKTVRDAVIPGTSALFVLSEDADANGLASELRGLDVEVYRWDLPPEPARSLRDALGAR
jgi:uncharacterized membrane protein